MAEKRTRREDLRERLVDAAERMVATDGLAAMKARTLADEAGCSVGAIYTAFADLDGLVLEVNRRTLALLGRDIAAVTARGARPAKGVDTAGAATEALVRLALAYLAFARSQPQRWRALFQHRLPDGAPAPAWYIDEQVKLFRALESPLAVLAPGLGPAALALRARSLFSAAHGVVALGLDEKLTALSTAELKRELEAIVTAAARGLMVAA